MKTLAAFSILLFLLGLTVSMDRDVAAYQATDTPTNTVSMFDFATLVHESVFPSGTPDIPSIECNTATPVPTATIPTYVNGTLDVERVHPAWLQNCLPATLTPPFMGTAVPELVCENLGGSPDLGIDDYVTNTPGATFTPTASPTPEEIFEIISVDYMLDFDPDQEFPQSGQWCEYDAVFDADVCNNWEISVHTGSRQTDQFTTGTHSLRGSIVSTWSVARIVLSFQYPVTVSVFGGDVRSHRSEFPTTTYRLGMYFYDDPSGWSGSLSSSTGPPSLYDYFANQELVGPDDDWHYLQFVPSVGPPYLIRDTSSYELVMYSGVGQSGGTRWVWLDNLSLQGQWHYARPIPYIPTSTPNPTATYTPDPLDPTQQPTPTNTPNFFDCSAPVYVEYNPVISPIPDVLEPIGTQCFTLIPSLDFSTVDVEFDVPVIGLVDIEFETGIDVQFQGFQLCFEWYEMPGIRIFDIYITLDWLLVLPMMWLVNRLLSF